MNREELRYTRDLARQQVQNKQAQHLVELTNKKLQTSFIFAIAEAERIFGFLWGHGKSIQDLNKEEYAFYELFKEFRKSVLDNGNNQIRTFRKEFEDGC